MTTGSAGSSARAVRLGILCRNSFLPKNPDVNTEDDEFKKREAFSLYWQNSVETSQSVGLFFGESTFSQHKNLKHE